MAENTAQTTPIPSDAEAPAAASAPESAAAPRRTVTVPVLPLAIVGAILVALIFFGGGVAVGFVIGDHPARVGIIQPFNNGRTSPFGGQNGFGQKGNNGGQNHGQNRPTPAPKNG